MALFGRPSERDDARAAEYRDWLRRRNPYAIASLVLGVFSLSHGGTLLVDAVAGIALGVVALIQLRRVTQDPAAAGESAAPAPGDAVVAARTGVLPYADAAAARPPDASAYEDAGPYPPRTHGRRLAWAGIVTSALSLVIAALLYTGVFG